MKMNNLRVVFEDNHLIAAIKKSGQTVQPEPGKPLSLEEEVKQYIKEKFQKPGEVFLGVIHRIDMPVSGLVLFARTSKALVRMNEIFQKREVKKIYLAKVCGRPPAYADLITHFLKRDEKKNFSKPFEHEAKGAQKAVLAYEVLKSEGKETLLRIELHTGRKHQIRAQLMAIGCPIVGDVKYGAPIASRDHSICLFSSELHFEHPVKKEIVDLICKSPDW
jgi:23S rRNA pseudouridine1911/1915/1917 synthase